MKRDGGYVTGSLAKNDIVLGPKPERNTFQDDIASLTLKDDGNCRGIVFSVNLRYVRKKRGAMGVKVVMSAMREAGYSFDPSGLHLTSWYPLAIELDLLRAIASALDWKERDIAEMGRYAAKNAGVLSYYLKHLVDIKTAMKHAPLYWRKLYSIGRMEYLETNGRSCTLCVKGFSGDPLFCSYIAGYLTGVCEMAQRGRGRVSVVEKECACNGDKIHRFSISWVN